MNESGNFRVALLSGGSTEWGEAVMPLLLAQTDSLLVAEKVDELFSLPSSAKPEIIFTCHQPGKHDGITAAEMIRSHFAVTPLVLLSAGNLKMLKAALTVGALAVLEPPFSEKDFTAAFNSCRHLALTLRWEALKHQQNRNRSELFMKSPFCQLFIDAGGLLSSINDEAAKVLGTDTDTAQEFSKISLRLFAPHASTYPLEMEMAVQSRSCWDGILAGRLPDGTLRLYRVICAPLTHSDGASGVLLTLYDITKVQAGQAQLSVALQAARDCLFLADNPETIAELQHLSSPECQAPLSQEIFSIVTLLESIKTSGSSDTAKASITIPDYMPKHFSGDARRLGNALKAVNCGSALFGESAPLISLSVKERTPARMSIQFNIRVESGAVLSDSYQGISDYLASSGNIPQAATGLGLAAILVEQINGTLLVRTERGSGRTVCFTVPLLPEADEQIPDSMASIKPLPEGTQVSLASLKVLVAEDNLIQQTTLKHILEGIGCQTILVGNGKEAVDEFESGEFDVILMDILMPVMDGFEATRLIRERERITGGKIPVVALTSYSLKAIQEKCVSVGMSGYLAKPVAKNKLVEALLRLSQPLELSAQSESISSNLNVLPVLETHSILENLGYNLGLYRELIEMYLADFAGHGGELAEKLAGDDIKDILECAHSLKGMVSSIGAQRLAEVARLIQNMCLEGIKPDSTLWVPIIKAQTAEIKEALEHLDWGILERFVAGKSSE